MDNSDGSDRHTGTSLRASLGSVMMGQDESILKVAGISVIGLTGCL
jgi:hypothetical protein